MTAASRHPFFLTQPRHPLIPAHASAQADRNAQITLSGAGNDATLMTQAADRIGGSARVLRELLGHSV
jgi:hypothetical protein